jgi:hypothetical protein
VIDRSRGLFFNELRRIGRHLYACGTGFQVVRREENGWRPIDEGIFVGAIRPIHILTSIDGQSETEIYAVGTGGTLFHYNGALWAELEFPTNYGLTKVRSVGGESFIRGFHGLLGRGNREGWEVLSGARGNCHLTDIEYCFDRLYVASEYDLSVLHQNSLSPVAIPLEGELSFGWLCSGFGQLWSVGGESILCFDGENWTFYRYPWNEPTEEG